MTRRPIEALESAKYFVKQVPVDQIGDTIIQRAINRLWMAAPWRWSVGSGPGFNLVTSQRDYDVEYPTDWCYPLKADLIVSDNLAQRPLEIISHVEQDDGYVGQPSKIYFSGPSGLVSLARVTPVMPAFPSGFTPRVTSLYKRTAPNYTGRAKYEEVIPFPDEWFWVFEDLVLYEAYRYTDDPRAGEVVVKGGDSSYSNQLASAMDGLNQMRLREPLVLLTDVPPQKDAAK